MKKLSSKGASHIIVPLFVVVAVALIGVYKIVASHAETISSTASTTAAAASTSTCGPSGAWKSSDPHAFHSEGGYGFINNEWGAVAGSAQAIWESSPGNWGVCAKQPNPPSGVKSYPEEQKNFNVAVGNLNDLRNTVSFSVPSNGTFNASDDLWIDALPGQAGAKEVMIWPFTHYQQPAGTKIGTVTFYNQTYNVWARSGSNSVFTFQLQNNETSGTLHMLSAFRWLVSHGYLRNSDTFKQFNWGFEIVGTAGTTENFTTKSFSLTED